MGLPKFDLHRVLAETETHSLVKALFHTIRHPIHLGHSLHLAMFTHFRFRARIAGKGH